MIVLKSKVFQNFSITTIFSLLNQFIGVVTSIRVTSYLGVEDYGLFTLMLVQVAIFSIITNFGLRQVIVRIISRDISKFTIGRILNFSFRIKFIAYLATVLSYLLYIHLAKTFSEYVTFISIVLILIFVQACINTLESIAYGLEKMWPSSALNTMITVFWAFFLFAFNEDFYGLENMILSYLMLQLLYLGVYSTWFYYQYRKVETFSSSQSYKIKTFFQEAFPFFILAIFTSVHNSLPVLMLELRSTAIEISYFNLGFRLVSPVNMMLFTLLMALYPMLCRVAEQNRDLFFERVKDLILVLVITGTCTAISFSLFSNEVVILLYGAEFQGSALVIELQVWYLIFFIVFSVFGTVLSAFNMQKKLARLSMVYAIVSMPIFFVSSTYGSRGLAIGFLLSAIGNFSYHLYYFWKWTGGGISIKFLIKLYLYLSLIVALVPLLLNVIAIPFLMKVVFVSLLFLALVGYLFRWYQVKLTRNST